MKKGAPKNANVTTRRLLSYLKEYRTQMAIAIICVIIGTLSNLGGAYMLRPIMNRFIAPLDGSRGDAACLAKGLAVMAAVFVVGVLANYAQSKIMITVAQNALQKIRDDLFKKMQTLPVRFYDTNNTGDLMSRFSNDVDTIGQMLSIP